MSEILSKKKSIAVELQWFRRRRRRAGRRRRRKGVGRMPMDEQRELPASPAAPGSGRHTGEMPSCGKMFPTPAVSSSLIVSGEEVGLLPHTS